MAQLLVVQKKQLIANHKISGQQYLLQQEGTAFVIDQAGQSLPQIHHQGEQLWVVLGEEEGLLLDAQQSAELFLQTPAQNYQLLAGQWVPVSGQPWIGSTLLAETVIAPVSESASIAGLSAFGLGALGLGGLGLAGSSGSDNEVPTPDPTPTPTPTPTPNPTPANQAPTDITLSATALAEGTAGATVGQLSTTDPDANDTHTYILSDDRFEVTNGYLKLQDGQLVDYATEQSIVLTVTAHDDHGAAYTETFTLNVQDDPNYPVPPTPANQAGSVSISGEAKVGSTLSATVSDADGVPANITYQWYADGQAINGANSSSYTLTAAETGKAISVRAAYVDQANHNETPLSSSTAAVADNLTPIPVNQAPTDITLSATALAEGQAGAVIGAIATTDADANDTHTYTVSDSRFEVVNGELKLKAGEKLEFATEPSVTLDITTDDGKGGSYTETFTLNVLDDPNYPVPPTPANQAGSVSISGEAKVGSTLSATVSDANGVPANITYQWYADGQAINGANSSSYTLTAAETGKAISVRASYTDLSGHAEQPGSAPSANVAEAVEISPDGYKIYTHAVYGKYMKVEDFGADLSGKTDSSPAIKTALAAAHSEGVALNFGAGKLFISEQIKIDASNENVTALFGEGKENTLITFNWQQQGEFNANIGREDIRKEAGILIDGISGKTVAHLAVEYQHQTPEDFYRTNDQGYGKSYFGKVSGILVNDADNTLIDSVAVSGANRSGVFFTSTSAVSGGSANQVTAPYGENNKLLNSDLHHNRVAGAMIAYQKDFLAEGNTLSWNGHEKDGGTGYGIASIAGSYNSGVTYRANTTDHNYRKGLDIHDGDGILIENNTSIGDRLNGIAVYNRAYFMGDVKILNNTVIADGDFRLAVDDGGGDKDLPIQAPEELLYYGYTAIQLQTNTQKRDFGDNLQGKYVIEGNKIKGLSIYKHPNDTFGIEFRNHEFTADYTVDIHKNHIEGEESKYLIAVINDTTDKGDPIDTTDDTPGLGSGNINITENTAIVTRISRGVPIYVQEHNVHQAELRGEVHIDRNTISIEYPNGYSQLIQLLGNAKSYTVNDNTFTLYNNPDNPVIGIFGSGASAKPVFIVNGNDIITDDKILPANWVQVGLQDRQGNVYDADLQVSNNVHTRDAAGNNDSSSDIADTLVHVGEQAKLVRISPNIQEAEFSKLAELASSQEVLDYIGRSGSLAFDTSNPPQTSYSLYGSRSDDILIAGSGADILTGNVGKDQFVFVSTANHDPNGVLVNTILDFNKDDDVIKLVAGDGERISNLRFDTASKSLLYEVQSGGSSYQTSIIINPRQTLQEDEVLAAVQII